MGVITIGAFEAPGGANIIQDTVTIKGTARYLNDELEQFMYQEIDKVAQSVAVGFDVTYDLDYQFGYPVLYNHPEHTQSVADILEESKAMVPFDTEERPSMIYNNTTGQLEVDNKKYLSY